MLYVYVWLVYYSAQCSDDYTRRVQCREQFGNSSLATTATEPRGGLCTGAGRRKRRRFPGKSVWHCVFMTVLYPPHTTWRGLKKNTRPQKLRLRVSDTRWKCSDILGIIDKPYAQQGFMTHVPPSSDTVYFTRILNVTPKFTICYFIKNKIYLRVLNMQMQLNIL